MDAFFKKVIPAQAGSIFKKIIPAFCHSRAGGNP
jgi:hypothetical protein